MAQVNVTVDNRIATQLDVIAQAKGVSRPDLVRSALQELIDAHDEGRLIFRNEAAPKLESSVNGLIHQLRELVIEMDRAQVENARLFGRLIENWNGGEEANRIAQQKLIAQFREQDAASLSPFFKKAGELLEAFGALEPSLIEALEPHLNRITDRLDKALELASEPREMRAVYLGDNRMLSLKFLSTCGAFLLSAGVLIGLILPSLFDGWSLWQANKLIDGPSQMCRLIERKYGTSECVMPVQERELGQRLMAREDGR